MDGGTSAWHHLSFLVWLHLCGERRGQAQDNIFSSNRWSWGCCLLANDICQLDSDVRKLSHEPATQPAPDHTLSYCCVFVHHYEREPGLGRGLCGSQSFCSAKDLERRCCTEEDSESTPVSTIDLLRFCIKARAPISGPYPTRLLQCRPCYTAIQHLLYHFSNS